MEDVSALVARQYDAYAYPEPFADLAAKVAGGYFQFGDPALYAPMLWPNGKPSRRLKILAAGCGTIQAAYLAFTNRDADVVGVDLSESALAHERFLQERHGLTNLRLYKGDLRGVASIGTGFDVIVCSGVLHHMADPDEGLRALRDVLAPDGVMNLMVYGATPRTGVYMLQDAFRRMGLKQDAAGVAAVRRVLAQLPERHFARWYIGGADELKHDTAIVDTFLHGQDRAYTVPQVLDFVETNGLVFQGWIDNAFYWPQASFDAGGDIGRMLSPLPEREQWAAVEMLTLACGMHVFLACKPERPRADFEISFAAPGWEKLIPHHAPGLAKAHMGEWRRAGRLLQLTREEAALFDGVDGVKTISELAKHPLLLGMPEPERLDQARRFFQYCWRLGHLMVSRVPYPRDR